MACGCAALGASPSARCEPQRALGPACCAPPQPHPCGSWGGPVPTERVATPCPLGRRSERWGVDHDVEITLPLPSLSPSARCQRMQKAAKIKKKAVGSPGVPACAEQVGGRGGRTNGSSSSLGRHRLLNGTADAACAAPDGRVEFPALFLLRLRVPGSGTADAGLCWASQTCFRGASERPRDVVPAGPPVEN